ncbi:MAG TPA: TRAP transporter small permease [Beijerinckiaceae bacterium]|nr:TRAP transporter small permease [Beijerinckiaceae bacterium]
MTASVARGPIGRALDRLYSLAGYLAACFLFIIFLLMMALSLGRGLRVNIPSGDDFAAWSMVAMAFLGLAHTFKNGEMIRVGLLLDRLDGKRRRVMEAATLTVAVLFIGFFAFHAFRFAHDSWKLNDLSQGVVAVPLWIPQAFFFAGLAILLIAVIDELVHVLRGNMPTFHKEPPKTTEELIERVVQGGGV